MTTTTTTTTPTPKVMTATEVYKAILTAKRAEKEKLREISYAAILKIQTAMLGAGVFEHRFEFADFSIQTDAAKESLRMELAALGYQTRLPVQGCETFEVVIPKVATRSPAPTDTEVTAADPYTRDGVSGRRYWNPSGPPEADVLDP